MKKSISKITSEIEIFMEESGKTEFQVLDELKKHYFEKLLTANLKLYKKKKKKVCHITRDLRISQRVFYAILRKKDIPYKKYNKNKAVVETPQETVS